MPLNIKVLLMLICAGFLVYFNSLLNGFVWEDWGQLVNNTLVHNIFNLPTFFTGGTYLDAGKLSGNLYRPLMLSYFSFIWIFFGSTPFFFHFFQVVIHITNSFLVYLFLKKFLKNKSSFFMSLIFLVHPINTEAVSYISIVNDPLYFLFGMLGLLVIDKLILLSGAFFLLSLLSKESGIFFIVISIIYTYLFNREKLTKLILINSIVFIIFYFLRVNIAHISFASSGQFPMERLPLFIRILYIPQIIIFYALMFVFPISLSVGRQWNDLKIISTAYISSLIGTLFIIVSLVFTGLKLIKRDQRSKYIFFSAWIVIGFGMYMQLFPLNMAVAERWFYAAGIGVIGIVGLVIDRFYKAKYIKFVFYAILIIIVMLGARTIVRNFNWKDDEALFSHDIQVSADSYMVQDGMGVVNRQNGKVAEAEKNFMRAFKLFPNDPAAVLNLEEILKSNKSL